MGSNSKDVQIAQKERAEQELAARIVTLTARGISEEKAGKDNIVRHLRSNIKDFRKRIATIDALGERKKKQAEQKAARVAMAEEAKKAGKKKSKKKEAAEQQQQQQGGKKKVKKKK